MLEDANTTLTYTEHCVRFLESPRTRKPTCTEDSRRCKDLVRIIGAVEKFVMITGDSIPNDLKRVTVSFGGMVGEVDAITVDDAESQGMSMDF